VEKRALVPVLHAARDWQPRCVQGGERRGSSWGSSSRASHATWR
jgi:hypothetical protein